MLFSPCLCTKVSCRVHFDVAGQVPGSRELCDSGSLENIEAGCVVALNFYTGCTYKSDGGVCLYCEYEQGSQYAIKDRNTYPVLGH